MNVTTLRLSDGFGNLYFHVGKREWKTLVRNAGNRLVYPLVPTARSYAKSEERFAKMRNFAIAVLSSQADCDFDLQNVATSKQGRTKK